MANRLAEFLTQYPDCIEVELTKVAGSTPREAGARLYVAANGICGTIGGGQLEYMAIDEAHRLLTSGKSLGAMDVPLGPEIGQCCGGRVSMRLIRMTTARIETRLHEEVQSQQHQPTVMIFGAGHVGRALANALLPLPYKAILIDSRAEELALCATEIDARHTAIPEMLVRQAPKGTAFVVVTHDHALDFLIASEALSRGDATYVGMIGSATKRTMFKRFLQDQWGTEGMDPLARLTCPIGTGFDPNNKKPSDKRPEVIAALVAAELIASFDRQALYCPTDQFESLT